MLNNYSYLFRNSHFYYRDTQFSFMKRCMNTKMTGELSRNQAFSICMQEYRYKNQVKQIKNIEL
jgi:hypothetical protein